VNPRGRSGRRHTVTWRFRGVRPAPRMPLVWVRNLRWRGWVPTSLRPGAVPAPGVLYSLWLSHPLLTPLGTLYPICLALLKSP
jgi:hypothetical protein